MVILCDPPPLCRETVKALTVTVIRADDLVVPAGRETCDPLVAVSVGSQREATTAKRKTVRPAWRESFKFTGLWGGGVAMVVVLMPSASFFATSVSL